MSTTEDFSFGNFPQDVLDQGYAPAQLVANGANLTGTPSERYVLCPEMLIRHDAFGVTYTIGVKGTF